MPKFILKDRSGNETTYERDVITVPSPEGEKLTFTYGTAASKEVALDMAEGDQIIEADEGTLLTAVTVKKPETLAPENIVEDVDIGGVVGNHGLNIAFGEAPPEDTKKLWVKISEKPTNTIVSCDAPTSNFIGDYAYNTGFTNPIIKYAGGRYYIFANGGDVGRLDIENQSIEIIDVVSPITNFIYSAVESVNDKVYIFGGYQDSAFLATIYRFDPETETFTLLPATLPTACRYMGSAVVGNKVYLCGGGSASSILKTIKVFDAETETISAFFRNLVAATDDPACAAIGQYVWVLGGYNGGALTTSQRIDTVNNTVYQYIASGYYLPVATYRINAVSALNKIYLFGGYNSSNTALDTIYVFDPSVPSMTKLSATMFSASSSFSGIQRGNSIFFSQGQNIYELVLASLSENDALIKIGSTDYPFNIYNGAYGVVKAGIENIYIGLAGGKNKSYSSNVLYRNLSKDYWQGLTTGEIGMDGSYSCTEVTSATTLTASVTCEVGALVIAAIATRDDLTVSDGWSIISTSDVNSNDTLGQRLSFAYKYAESTTENITVTQASAQRLYINLISFAGATGFIDNGYHYDNNDNGATKSITIDKPNGLVLWAATNPLASTPNEWRINNGSFCIQLGTDTQARLVIAPDQSESKSVTLSQPSTTSIIVGSLTIQGIEKFYW